MTSVQQLLLDTLADLVRDKMKTFKWHLKEDHFASAADLEKAEDATDAVDLMVERRGPEGAVKITLAILRKMNENHLAKQLEDEHKGNYISKPTMTFHQLQCKQSVYLCRV